MLIKQEKIAYSIAAHVAMDDVLFLELDDTKYYICHVCQGAGLLAHPSEYMNVAFCYMCNGTGLVVPKKAVQFEGCGCANTKTISA